MELLAFMVGWIGIGPHHERVLKVLEKKNVFPKKYVELRTFDGTVHIVCALIVHTF